MNRNSSNSLGFTGVDLLVTVAVLGLLVTVAAPALTGARKQALEAACSANLRQVTVAGVVYSDDYKDQLPNKWHFVPVEGVTEGYLSSGNPLFGLMQLARLPIVGFDTATTWSWGTYIPSGYTRTFGIQQNYLGGLGFLMRDYLMNDFEAYTCPDGWFEKSDFLTKWSGAASEWAGPARFPGEPTQYDFKDALNHWRTGYLWLPHRHPGWPKAAQCEKGVSMPSTDKPELVARTVMDEPGLPVMADFHVFHDRHFRVPGCPPPGGCGLAGNHSNSPFRRAPTNESSCLPRVFPPDIAAQAGSKDMPAGMNRSRLDARVDWVRFADWDYYRYVVHPAAMWFAF